MACTKRPQYVHGFLVPVLDVCKVAFMDYYTLKTADQVRIVTPHATLPLLSKAGNNHALVVLSECM